MQAVLTTFGGAGPTGIWIELCWVGGACIGGECIGGACIGGACMGGCWYCCGIGWYC